MYREEKRNWMKHLDFTILDMLMMELALMHGFLIMKYMCV